MRQTLRVKRNVAVGDEVARLWRKHANAEFPARLRGEEVGDVNMVELEADIANCIRGWRSEGGTLDDERSKILTQRIEDLDAVMPLLTSRVEVLYFERLCQLAVVVLDS